MNEKKSYAGIDDFRLIAALLIVAIHTSPLASFSETGDFILTRIFARVAVPFFFTTSGFFLVSRYTYNAEKLGAFVKKQLLFMEQPYCCTYRSTFIMVILKWIAFCRT